MDLGYIPKSPSFTEDPRGWNTAWELHLARIFGSDLEIISTDGSLAGITENLPTEVYDDMATDKTAEEMDRLTYHIRALQHDLIVKGSEKIFADGFEGCWRQLSPHEREEFILEGLVATCEVSALYEAWREWCPELTLKRLNDRSGEGFIILLHDLRYPASQESKEAPHNYNYTTIPNAAFDEMISHIGPGPHPGCVMLQRVIQGQRTYLLTMVVWHVLLAFYGEPAQFESLKQRRAGHKRTQESLQWLLAPGMTLKLLRKLTDACKAERYCTSCRLPARLVGVDTLLVCQRCKAINREVFYCSRKCQTTDWKTGTPPHKVICGKTHYIAADLASTTASYRCSALLN
ncbi:hypothetical protein DFH06DRAFT_1470786 [Mycena polygramma]|nr:hypothetical protein DFH06DRAFT_1470786 [Mycena polygramma]